VMDALAIEGEERRGRLRYAPGSRLPGFDPRISE
jgi:hypothetical protein